MRTPLSAAISTGGGRLGNRGDNLAYNPDTDYINLGCNFLSVAGR